MPIPWHHREPRSQKVTLKLKKRLSNRVIMALMPITRVLMHPQELANCAFARDGGENRGITQKALIRQICLKNKDEWVRALKESKTYYRFLFGACSSEKDLTKATIRIKE